jgi:hypothetical protein
MPAALAAVDSPREEPPQRRRWTARARRLRPHAHPVGVREEFPLTCANDVEAEEIQQRAHHQGSVISSLPPSAL